LTFSGLCSAISQKIVLFALPHSFNTKGFLMF
jgi:hypothetical protein